MLRVERLTTFQDIVALKDEWERLLGASPGHGVFMTWEWLATWWEIFGASHELWWLVVRDASNQLVAGAPLYLRWRRNRWQPRHRELRWMGSGEAVFPEHLDLVVHPDHVEGAVQALGDYLTARVSDWDVCRLTDVSHRHAAVYRLMSILATHGVAMRRASQVPAAPFIPLPSSWETYLSGLKRSMRGNVKRRRRKVADELNAVFEIWAPGRQDLGDALEELAALHARRKHSQDLASKFDHPSYRRFHGRLATRCAERGWLYLAMLRVRGQAVAVQYAFAYRQRLYGYQTGFDPAYGTYGVYQVLVGHIVEELIGRGFVEFDLLSGEEPYKFDWTTQMRRKWTVVGYSPTLHGQTVRRWLSARRLAGQAIRTLQAEGLPGLLRRGRQVVARVDQLVFYRGNGSLPTLERFDNGVACRELQAYDGAAWAQVARLKGKRGWAKIARRRRLGHRCLVGISQDRIVHVSWVNPTGWSVVDGQLFNLPHDAAFLYDTFTVEEMQGQGVARQVFCAMHRQLAGWGKRQLYALVREDNTASVASLTASGFIRTPIVVKRVKIGSRSFVVRPTVAVHQLQEWDVNACGTRHGDSHGH